MDTKLHTTLQRVVARDVEPLLNACFPVLGGRSFFDDFPIWRDGAAVEWWAATQQDQVVACAGWVPAVWQIPGLRPLAIARVGGVATHSNLRGQGVGSVLVEACIERARKADLQAVALWGLESPLYARLGFKARGLQLRVPLKGVVSELARLPERRPAELRLELGFDDQILPLMQLTRSQSGGVALTPEDLGWIRAHQNTQWARVIDSSERVVAYGAFGRGIDLGDQLHDWGAEAPSALTALPMILRWAQSLTPQAEWMGPRSWMEQFLGRSFESESSCVREPACMLLELKESVLPSDDSRIWFWGFDGV